MEPFNGLTASALLIRPPPLRKYRDVCAIDIVRPAVVIKINKLREALDSAHEAVEGEGMVGRTRTLK